MRRETCVVHQIEVGGECMLSAAQWRSGRRWAPIGLAAALLPSPNAAEVSGFRV